MEELHVKPNYWFETEINGCLYKCKIKRYGYTFVSIHVKQIMGMKQRMKYYFFGPIINVPILETITRSHRDDGIDPIIEYKPSYKAKGIKMVIEQIIEQKPNKKHSYKI